MTTKQTATATAPQKVQIRGFLIKPKDAGSPFKEFTRYEEQVDEDFGVEVRVPVESFHSFTLLQKDRENPDDKSKQRWIRCRFYGAKAPEECQANDLVQVTGSLQVEPYHDRKTGEEKIARFVAVRAIETIWRRKAKNDADTYDGPQEHADLPNDSGAPVNPATAAQVAAVRAAAVEKKAAEAEAAVKETTKARRNLETVKNSASGLSPEAHAAALKTARERLQEAEENEKRTASQLASLKRQAAIA